MKNKISNLDKFVRELSTWKKQPKKNELVFSFGSPIESVEDIIGVCEMVSKQHQVTLEENIVNDLCEDYLLDKTDKDHLVFNCEKDGNDYHYYGMFVSNKQVQFMQTAEDAFNQQN